MRRRLTLSMVLITIAALVVTGIVTLAVTVHATRDEARTGLTREARVLVATIEADARPATDPHRLDLARILRSLKGPLRLDQSAVLELSAGGVLFPPAKPYAAHPLPNGLAQADLQPGTLLAGDIVAGHRGSLVFAAAPFTLRVLVGSEPRLFRGVVVLTQRAPTGLRAALPWLLVTSILVTLLAVVVADRLSRRILRPLQAARRVTATMAGGDLSARLELPSDADPEIAALASSINAMGEDLGAARGAQRQFFLSVSHDLRTPLTSIRGFAEALEDGTATDATRAGAIIVAEARRLERLVDDLLELGRLETRQFSLRPRPVALGAAVASGAAAFEPAAAELGLHLTVATGRAPDVVLADPDRLSQVLANLVENALSFATSTVHVASDGAVLWVDDDGPGIAPGELDRVFSAAFRSTARPGRRVGTGLGLAIVSELVRSMGGHVEAASPLGPAGGTRMTVALPAAPDDPAPNDPPPDGPRPDGPPPDGPAAAAPPPAPG